METAYSQSGNSFHILPKVSLVDDLPPFTFTVKKDPMSGSLYLQRIEDFKLPAERYGNNDSLCERVLNTFRLRNKQTGILLTGEKGSGKSLLAQTISLNAQQEGLPTIVINEPWAGEAFNMFVQSIKQRAVILFDEFEKVYPQEHQEAVLTLLDGMYPSNKLYVFTANDKWRLNAHMRNRPGRIFYALDYKGLDAAFIRMYCGKNLDDKNQTETVVRVATIFREFNFDMLKALCEEMNRYKESAQEAVKFLNIKPEFDSASNFDVVINPAPGVIMKRPYKEKWKGNPLTVDRIELGYYKYASLKDKEEGLEDYEVGEWTASDLNKVDPENDSFEFTNTDGEQLILTREKYIVRNGFEYV